MWRECCEAVGGTYIEDKKTLQGAEGLARDLFDTGKADADTIRRGMKNLLAMKAAEPKAKLYTLGTLCRNFSAFADMGGAQAARSQPAEKYVWRHWECDKCHDSISGKRRPNDPTPDTIPCNQTRGCTGTMQPKLRA